MPLQTVNARDLHAFLQVGTRFNDWIGRRIDEYGFTESHDFYSSVSTNSDLSEIFLTIDAAKELAMVERNERGRVVPEAVELGAEATAVGLSGPV